VRERVTGDPDRPVDLHFREKAVNWLVRDVHLHKVRFGHNSIELTDIISFDNATPDAATEMGFSLVGGAGTDRATIYDTGTALGGAAGVRDIGYVQEVGGKLRKFDTLNSSTGQGKQIRWDEDAVASLSGVEPQSVAASDPSINYFLNNTPLRPNSITITGTGGESLTDSPIDAINGSLVGAGNNFASGSVNYPTGQIQIIYGGGGATGASTLTNDYGYETGQFVNSFGDLGPYVVGPEDGDPYNSISAAVAAAPNGSTIFVKPGTYTETAAIATANEVFIKGVGVDADTGNHTVQTNSTSVRVDFTTSGDGGFIFAARATLENIEVNTDGIAALFLTTSCERAQIKNCRLYATNLTASGQTGNAIYNLQQGTNSSLVIDNSFVRAEHVVANTGSCVDMSRNAGSGSNPELHIVNNSVLEHLDGNTIYLQEGSVYVQDSELRGRFEIEPVIGTYIGTVRTQYTRLVANANEECVAITNPALNPIPNPPEFFYTIFEIPTGAVGINAVSGIVTCYVNGGAIFTGAGGTRTAGSITLALLDEVSNATHFHEEPLDITGKAAGNVPIYNQTAGQWEMGDILTPYVVGPDDTDPYNTVAAAVTAANADTTREPRVILIKPKGGAYIESGPITINRSMVIKAIGSGTWTQDRVAIQFAGTGFTFGATGLRCTLEDLQITVTGPSAAITSTIHNSGNRWDVRNCYIVATAQNNSRCVLLNARQVRLYSTGTYYWVTGNNNVGSTGCICIYNIAGDVRLFEGNTLQANISTGSRCYQQTNSSNGTYIQAWSSRFWGQIYMQGNASGEWHNTFHLRVLYDRALFVWPNGAGTPGVDGAGAIFDKLTFSQDDDTHTSNPVQGLAGSSNIKLGDVYCINQIPAIAPTAFLYINRFDEQETNRTPLYRIVVGSGALGSAIIAGQDTAVFINTAGGVGSVNLPTYPSMRQTVWVGHNNATGANNITINGNGRSIARPTNVASITLTPTERRVMLIYDGTVWRAM
jgi:hypothetical protein